jgi:hypothetical protein
MCDFQFVSNGLIINRIEQHQRLLTKIENGTRGYIHHIVQCNCMKLTVDWARESLYYTLSWRYDYQNGLFLAGLTVKL